VDNGSSISDADQPCGDRESETRSLLPSVPTEFLRRLCNILTHGDAPSAQAEWKMFLDYERQILHTGVNTLIRHMLGSGKLRKQLTPDTEGVDALLHFFVSQSEMCAKELRHVFLHLAQIYDELNNVHQAREYLQKLFALDGVVHCLDQEGAKDLGALLLHSANRDSYLSCLPANRCVDIRKALEKIEEIAALAQQVRDASVSPSGCLKVCEETASFFRNASCWIQEFFVPAVIRLFKELQRRRSQPNVSYEDTLLLSEAMLRLNEALRARTRVSPSQRFNDLYNFHQCLVGVPTLWEEAETLRAIQHTVRQALEIGEELLRSSQTRSVSPRSYFYSQLGELCRAHRLYG